MATSTSTETNVEQNFKSINDLRKQMIIDFPIFKQINNLTKINKLLGFSPKYHFKEGVSKFIKWVKNQEVMEDRYDKSLQVLKSKG